MKRPEIPRSDGTHRAWPRGGPGPDASSGAARFAPAGSDSAARLAGRYCILDVIGAGGMGVVYRARDERLGRDVAIKVLPPGESADHTALGRFRREALALSRLNHPNIAVVFDFDRHDGTDFLVMEYVEGMSLDGLLGAGPFPEPQIVEYGVQLLQGLAAAHARGVIHRDLKPGNLMITGDGRLRILDFGLAKLRGMPGLVVDSLTAARVALGTLPYMAPEVLRGAEPDPRSDLYAAGAVLYELATGHRAFPQAPEPMVIDAILHARPDPPRRLRPGLGVRLERFILRALESSTRDRYQTAEEMLADLRGLAVERSAGARAQQAWRLSGWAWVGAALVAVAMVTGVFVVWRRIPPAPPPTMKPPVQAVSRVAEGRLVERVAELSSPAGDFSAAFSKDGLEIIVQRTEVYPVTGRFGDSHLYEAHRGTPSSPFGVPAPVCGVYSEASDLEPWLSDDGLRLYFNSTRCSGGPYSCLFLAERPDTSACFATPALLLSASPGDVAGPSLTGDERTMFFMRRLSPERDSDIWRATRRSRREPFGPAEPVREVNTEHDESTPFVSHDGQFLCFASNRPGGLGGFDLWACRRPSAGVPFGGPVNLAVANSDANDNGPTLAPTGELYFYSDRPRGTAYSDVWRLRLVPTVSAPSPGQVVHGRVRISAPVRSLGLVKGALSWRWAGADSWAPPQAQLHSAGSLASTDSMVAFWVTDDLPDGRYEIRLWAVDTLGVSGSVVVPVLVSNRPRR